jgi:hypothetical protein
MTPNAKCRMQNAKWQESSDLTLFAMSSHKVSFANSCESPRNRPTSPRSRTNSPFFVLHFAFCI